MRGQGYKLYIYIGFFFCNFTFILNGSGSGSGSGLVLQKPKPNPNPLRVLFQKPRPNPTIYLVGSSTCGLSNNCHPQLPLTRSSIQNHYLCHLQQRNPNKVNAYPQSCQATPRSIMLLLRSRLKPSYPFIIVPLQKKKKKNQGEKREVKSRRLQEIGQLEVAFFEPLDHLITTMCPLSIQKRKRTGGFLMGEEPNPFIPTYDNVSFKCSFIMVNIMFG